MVFLIQSIKYEFMRLGYLSNYNNVILYVTIYNYSTIVNKIGFNLCLYIKTFINLEFL